LGEGTEDTRRRVVMSNLVTAKLSLEAIERVVRRLADEKLVVTDDREKRKVSGDAIVDVAHEALIRGWKLLRGWLDEDRQNLRQQRWIEDRAIEWQGSGKVKEFLLSGRQLKDAGKFQQQQVDRFPLSELAEQLLKVSKSQQKKGWAFLAAVYMAIPITVAIVLGGLTIRWWYLETKWAVLRRCEKEQTEDGSCTGRLEALRVLIDANVSLPIDLSNANLRNADLSNANLSNATLLNTDLRLANLAYANLRNTNLNKTKLNNANLTKVNFSNAILIDSDLSNAILAYADLSGAKIIEVNLSNAILLNSDLSYAQISNTKMDRAMFLNANLDKSYLMNLSDISTIKEACNWEKASVLGKTEFKTQFEKVPDYLKNARECSQWENHPD
jgi:hypothetical protein